MDSHSEITVIKVDKEYRSCNCCSSKGGLYEISFMRVTGKGSTGMSVVLCKECMKDLKIKLKGVNR